jgi:SpoVK/Ycf46/Vps4 family AAA+-type ATPase
LPLEPGCADGLRRLGFRTHAEGAPLQLWFRGAAMPLKRTTAEALAAGMGRPLLALAAAGDSTDTILIAVREALLSNAILFIDLESGAMESDDKLTRILAQELAASGVDAILAAQALGPALDSLALAPIDFPPASFATRREEWRRSLSAEKIGLSDADLNALAGRFRLYPDQVGAAVSAARNQARWRGDKQPSASDLSAAARAQSGRNIGTMARKIEPAYGWDDIVLPASTLNQLRAICGRVGHGLRVLEEWGFDRKLSMGKGVTVLFAGPSGVGKTMAAEVIARDLQIDLYKIDLSGVVSKYIGETEKNLERIFTAAGNANAILFFDEADALFGKRSEVRDSHDRYANIEISYLLQKMEMYDGIAILASNLRQNLDESFVRRLAFTVHFPFPDEAHRRRIWTGIWPKEAPLDTDVDFDFLAKQFKLSGGNIKNVALAAAFLAAEEDSAIAMRHLVVAVEREYQKMSKPLGPEQFGPYAVEARP